MDVEVGMNDHRIHDIGAIRWDGAVYHSANKHELTPFLKDVDFICGHNIINHDTKYLFGEENYRYLPVDTLFLSPLLFPERPYHRLVKDDKLVSDQMNNPVNDCEKASDLLMDEVARWEELSSTKKLIYSTLLQCQKEFKGFLTFVNAQAGRKESLAETILSEYAARICGHADIATLINQYPIELAYALALIDT
ncbi:MAG: RecQ family ATP-dependent DNA helicase, partial [Muribaculaceae bacterium]